MSSQLGATAAPGPFGLGSQIFGGSPPEPENKVKVDSSQEPESEDEQNGESDDGSEEDDDEEVLCECEDVLDGTRLRLSGDVKSDPP